MDAKQKKVKDIEDLKAKLCHLKNKGAPYEPDQDDCCGSGCTPCVFDTYYDQLEKFEERCNDLESRIIEYEEDLQNM